MTEADFTVTRKMMSETTEVDGEQVQQQVSVSIVSEELRPQEEAQTAASSPRLRNGQIGN